MNLSGLRPWSVGSVILLSVFLVPLVSQAAALYIDPAFPMLNRGDAVALAVRLDVDEEAGECVNAVDAVITYPSFVEPIDISRGQSIMSMWVEEPTIDEVNRQITFAGGIPNGYCGRIAGDPRLTNTLVTLIFRSPGFVIDEPGVDNSEAIIAFSDQTTVYLNDGLGTKVSPATYPAMLRLNRQVGTEIVDEWVTRVQADRQPPEEFSIILQQNERMFRNRYFIVFNTTDKQTGIDEYQVMEEPISQFGTFEWGRADAVWITARSPYVLKDQSLNSIIRVKAIDKAGNEYVATIIPDESLRTLSREQLTQWLFVAGAGLIGLLCLVILGLAIRGYLRRRKEYQAEEAENDYLEDEIDEEVDEEVSESDSENYENR